MFLFDLKADHLIDFRCGFGGGRSKQISQVFLRKNNGAEVNMQFGCGIYQVNLKNSEKDVPIHSFIISYEAKMKFDFSD